MRAGLGFTALLPRIISFRDQGIEQTCRPSRVPRHQAAQGVFDAFRRLPFFGKFAGLSRYLAFLNLFLVLMAALAGALPLCGVAAGLWAGPLDSLLMRVAELCAMAALALLAARWAGAGGVSPASGRG